MAENPGVLIVTEDTVIRGVGEMRNCRQLEIYGYMEGEVAAKSVLIHKNGKLFGKVKTDIFRGREALRRKLHLKLKEAEESGQACERL